MLRRAGDHPNSISLRCWSSEGESSPLQDLLTPQLAHLTSLTIEVPRLDGTFWSDILCAPAPCLERLLVCTSADQAQRLPDNLLSGNAPNLTELVLSNVFIPAVPCAVLGNVTSLRLLKVKFMSLADMNLVFTQFAKLEHLLMDVISGDGGETTSLHTVPSLRSLRIRDFVWPGPLDLLVRALQPDGQLFLAWPRPVHIEEVIAQLQRSKSGWNALSVRWSTQVIGIINMPAALALVASSDTGGARGALFVESERVALQLRAAASRVTMAKELSIADDTWSRIVDLGTFTRLEILTLDLAPQSGQANYAHLFILQQPPMAELCPALREVRLVRDPVRASKIDFVRVGAVYLSQWLPSTVKKLLLRGVKAVEPGVAALYGQVEELCLESSEGDFDRVAEETRKWSWNFSFEDAVHAG
ncbi:hypothetical protein EXIGLDRAFT_127533 [Exidia glandulosa HHB12029]|uniref:F-box domain-containing protein n=1 Tax=Exidia glandulosa HHB12029 TaxID=1314781 RepID=A0A166AAL3_EXIGL|nr:hypothetical protein EXIGLDRAFT_127533 [Exidia glandulosa HHB12029]